MHAEKIDSALALLPDWYAVCARDLPWRADREPYHVWVSEIMLQQTRVEAVKDYYIRFLRELPAVEDLASCEEEKLLKLWEGLGYYSRVRNLHKAARTIVSDYNGVFPDHYDEIRSLSGIGPYTAGAVASIAFRLPEAAVDGNVLRVLSRLTDDERDIRTPAVRREAAFTISGWLKAHPQQDPGIVNQALMELGAIVCVPNGAPHCGDCPWHKLCAAEKNGTISQRPVKAKAKMRRIEQRTILMIADEKHLLLHRREKTGLLAGMYEPLNLPGRYEMGEIPALVRARGFSPLRVMKAPETKHIFTHIEWEMSGYLVQIEEPEGFPETERDFFADRGRIGTGIAVPSAYRVYLEWLKESGVI